MCFPGPGKPHPVAERDGGFIAANSAQRGHFSTGYPTLAWAHDVGADRARTNVNGGAIAIGHPLGASGARIMTTMVNALEQRGGRYGLQTMCAAGGMANATIIERLG